MYSAVVMMRMHLLALASEAFSLVGWYRIDDFLHSEKRLGTDYVHFHLGVLDAHGRPKATFDALRTYNRLLGGPVRTVRDARLHSKQRSQAVVTAMEKPGGEMIVSGWLRSSEHDEIPKHTGALLDQRAETVTLTLPCRKLSRLRTYDARGRAVRSSARLAGKRLQDIRLRGDGLFLAAVKCDGRFNSQ
jgi:hypothetical protein